MTPRAITELTGTQRSIEDLGYARYPVDGKTYDPSVGLRNVNAPSPRRQNSQVATKATFYAKTASLVFAA